MNEGGSSRSMPVVLVRCRPDGPGGDRVIERISGPTGEPLLVFFHGDGVEFAGRSDQKWLEDVVPGSELLVCTGSWARRRDAPVPLPFRAGSLITLFTRLVPVSGPRPELTCFGRGDD